MTTQKPGLRDGFLRIFQQHHPSTANFAAALSADQRQTLLQTLQGFEKWDWSRGLTAIEILPLYSSASADVPATTFLKLKLKYQATSEAERYCLLKWRDPAFDSEWQIRIICAQDQNLNQFHVSPLYHDEKNGMMIFDSTAEPYQPIHQPQHYPQCLLQIGKYLSFWHQLPLTTVLQNSSAQSTSRSQKILSASESGEIDSHLKNKALAMILQSEQEGRICILGDLHPDRCWMSRGQLQIHTLPQPRPGFAEEDLGSVMASLMLRMWPEHLVMNLMHYYSGPNRSLGPLNEFSVYQYCGLKILECLLLDKGSLGKGLSRLSAERRQAFLSLAKNLMTQDQV